MYMYECVASQHNLFDNNVHSLLSSTEILLYILFVYNLPEVENSQQQLYHHSIDIFVAYV